MANENGESEINITLPQNLGSARPDISRRALSVARLVDRLPEGTFEMRLIKRESGWSVVVSRLIHFVETNFTK